MCLGGEFAGVSLEVRVRQVAPGVELHVVELHSVHLGPSLQQRQHLHVEPQAPGVQQCVARLDGEGVVDGQVQRKGQPHLADAYVHAHAFRQHFGGFLHHEVLHRGQIYQQGQQQEECYGGHQNGRRPSDESSVLLLHRCKCKDFIVCAHMCGRPFDFFRAMRGEGNKLYDSLGPRLALTCPRSGCGSGVQNENLSAFLLHFARLALTLHTESQIVLKQSF